MNAQRPDIELLVAQVEAGRLDDLSPEQVAALEAALNESPALSARLAELRPPTDARLQARVASPTELEWAQAWNAIDSGVASQRAERQAPAGRIYTLGRAAFALAACVGLVVLWRLPANSRPDATGWELAASDNTEILELEVFGGRSSTLHFADDGSGAVGISIGDPDDSDSGA